MSSNDLELILLGAGASQEAGIPPAKKMVKTIRDALWNRGSEWAIVGRAIDIAIGGLMQQNASIGEPFADIDIENLFATLDELGTRGSNALAPFVAAWSQPVTTATSATQEAHVNEVVRMLEDDLNEQNGETFHDLGRGRTPQRVRLRRFRHALRDLYRSTSGTPSDPFQFATLLILRELLRLCWIEEPARVAYLEPLVQASVRRPLWIATLNFDNSIELAARSGALLYDIGITGGYQPIEFAGTSRLTLAKLHGSVNWSRPDPWRIEIKDHPDLDAALIFGAGNKLRVEGPFLDLLLAFRAKLDSVDHLTMCGYSFRDEHINHTLVRWMQLNPAARISAYGLDISIDSVSANLNANLGVTTLTKNKISLTPDFLPTRLTIYNLKASDWVAQFADSVSSA